VVRYCGARRTQRVPADRVTVLLSRRGLRLADAGALEELGHRIAGLGALAEPVLDPLALEIGLQVRVLVSRIIQSEFLDHAAVAARPLIHGCQPITRPVAATRSLQPNAYHTCSVTRRIR